MSKTLDKVKAAAARHAKTRAELDAAIIAARQADDSLRAVADAAGVSHEQIRKIAA